VSIRQIVVSACLLQWPGKKIQLDEEEIGQILVADTDSESGSGASGFEEYFEEEGGEEQHHHHHQQQQQTSAEVGIQAATSGELPTCGPPQGRNTNIHPFVGPAQGVKKVRLHTSTKLHTSKKTARHSMC
jgi:hypothetical protein